MLADAIRLSGDDVDRLRKQIAAQPSLADLEAHREAVEALHKSFLIKAARQIDTFAREAENERQRVAELCTATLLADNKRLKAEIRAEVDNATKASAQANAAAVTKLAEATDQFKRAKGDVLRSDRKMWIGIALGAAPAFVLGVFSLQMVSALLGSGFHIYGLWMAYLGTVAVFVAGMLIGAWLR